MLARACVIYTFGAVRPSGSSETRTELDNVAGVTDTFAIGAIKKRVWRSRCGTVVLVVEA